MTDYTKLVDPIKEAKRVGDLARAEDLCLKAIKATEAEAAREGCAVAPWYYEQLAIVYRKQKRYADEVGVLERYERQMARFGVSETKFSERLEKAQRLLSGGAARPTRQRTPSARKSAAPEPKRHNEETGKEFHSRIAGVSYKNDDGVGRQALLRKCRTGEELALERDHNNPHSTNAVKILRKDGTQLGWVTERAADSIAPALDTGENVRVWITEVTGGSTGREHLGANIRFTIGEVDEPLSTSKATTGCLGLVLLAGTSLSVVATCVAIIVT